LYCIVNCTININSHTTVAHGGMLAVGSG